MQNDTKKICPYGDDIVSYMYEEMPVAERSAFEGHLVACEVCTDEFAAVSLSRFEAYDWKRIEFDPLTTPRIVIPYAEKTVSFGERLSAWMSWVTVVPALATIILAAMVGLIFWTNSRGPDPSQTEVLTVKGSPVVDTPVVQQVAPKPEVASNPGRASQMPQVERIVTKNKPSVPKSQFARRLSPGMKLGNDMAMNVATDMKHAPRLGIRDEEDDRSLRLSDLFDETNPPPQR